MTDPLLIAVPERLQTERLVLRCPGAGDGHFLHESVRDSLAELKPWMPWAQAVPSPEQSEALARGARADFIRRADLVYAIFEHDGSGLETRHVGGTGLHRIDWSVPRFEIGYWRRTGCDGKGFVTEAVNALAAMAFDALSAERVEIRCDANNAASRRVAERCGFTLEAVLRRDSRTPAGELRDTCIFARLRDRNVPAPLRDPDVPARLREAGPA